MDLQNLSREEKVRLLTLLEEKENRKRYNFCDSVFTDDGPTSRELYKKHVEFMFAGAKYPTRALLGGNQLGKTTLIGCELNMHLTGKYPDWWEGYRFDRPIKAWIVSVDNKQMVEAAQRMMMGEVGDFGTGMIRKDDIKKEFSAPGISGGLARVLVKWRDSDDQYSTLLFKSNEQKMTSFAGDTIDYLWADEEIRKEILGECRMRLVARNGLEVHTFTPVDGFTEVVKSFLPNLKFPDKKWCDEHKTFVMQITWDDCPHFSEEKRKEMYNRLLPHEREARSKGLPCISEGRIYDIPEGDFVISPFVIPEEWPKCYGFDVGAKVNAALWAAYDEQNDTWYIYDEYYALGANPDVHASAIRRKSKWFMPGLLDSAARQGSQLMETSLWDIYVELGLNVSMPDKSVEAGIATTYDRLATGRVKVFRNCVNLLQEYRLYRYDPNKPGHPARHQADHALDTFRYIMMSGLDIAEPEPDPFEEKYKGFEFEEYNDGRDSVTGY